MMFKRQTLVLIKRLNTLSKPFSIISIAFSKASNLSCASCILQTLKPSLERVLKDASTHSNSLKFSKFSSHDTTLLCINLVTLNHLFAFDFDAETAKKDKSD